MKKVLITLVKLIILVVLLGIFGIVGIVGYSEIQATKAKEHLIMEYDFTDWNVFAIKVTEYVYEKETDCSTLWFKKCTDNKDLAKEFTFLTTEGETFDVTEYTDGTFDVGLPQEDDNEKKES